MAQKASAETKPETLFDKAADLTEGDTLELLGESLRVGHIQRSAAGKTVSLYGAHEDTDQHPRYTLGLDARYESVEILPERAEGGR